MDSANESWNRGRRSSWDGGNSQPGNSWDRHGSSTSERRNSRTWGDRMPDSSPGRQLFGKPLGFGGVTVNQASPRGGTASGASALGLGSAGLGASGMSGSGNTTSNSLGVNMGVTKTLGNSASRAPSAGSAHGIGSLPMKVGRMAAPMLSNLRSVHGVAGHGTSQNRSDSASTGGTPQGLGRMHNDDSGSESDCPRVFPTF